MPEKKDWKCQDCTRTENADVKYNEKDKKVLEKLSCHKQEDAYTSFDRTEGDE